VNHGGGKMKKAKLFKTLAVTMVLAMSTSLFVGCGDDSSKNASTDTSAKSIEDSVTQVKTKLTNAKLDGEKAPVEGTVLTTMTSFTPPPAGHGNPAVNGGPDWSVEPIIYDYLCDYSSQPQKTFKPSLLEKYEFKDRVLTLTLKKDLKWSDGTPLNADDLICNTFIDMTVNKVAYFADSVTKKDDLTVEIKYNKDANLLLDYILKSAVKYPAAEYGKWAEQFKVAFEKYREFDDNKNYKFNKDGDKLVADTTKEFNNYLPDILKIKCSGAYVPTKVTSSETIFERNKYFRNPPLIEKIRGLRPTTTESTAIALMNKEYDAEGMGISPDLAKKVAENNKDTIRQLLVPEYSSFGFCFNINKAPTDDVRVRKAIAYIVDKAQIAPVSEPGMRLGDEYGVGLPPSVRDKYLSKDFLKTLANYTMDKDKATKLLEEAGWSKKGGKWVNSKGESPEIKIAGVGEYPAFVVMGEAAANMLKDFGLNATFTPKEAAAYNDYSTSGDAHMVVDGFGSPTNTQHPYEAYDGIWWYGKKMNIKFPTSGGLVFKDEVTGKDFKYSEKEMELFSAKDDKEVSAKTEEFAKFFNDNMWYLPVTEKYYIFRINNPKLSMPEAKTGEQLKDFYWSGTTSAILGKSLRSGQMYYIK
jgi:peptide/nickel transport system substrate-binding protein